MQFFETQITSYPLPLLKKNQSEIKLICTKILTKQSDFVNLLIRKGAYLSRSEFLRNTIYLYLYNNLNFDENKNSSSLFDPLYSFDSKIINQNFQKIKSFTAKIPTELLKCFLNIKPSNNRSASIRIAIDRFLDERKFFHNLYLNMDNNEDTAHNGNIIGLKIPINQIKLIYYYINLNIYISFSEFIRTSIIDLINDYYINHEGNLVVDALLQDDDELILKNINNEIKRENVCTKIRKNFIVLIDKIVDLNKISYSTINRKNKGIRTIFVRFAITRLINKTELLIEKFKIDDYQNKNKTKTEIENFV